MSTNFKELDQILQIICEGNSESGISYSEIHDIYFNRTNIMLGDAQLKPILDHLKKDNYIVLKSLVDGVEYYTENLNAASFLANGGYQTKAAKENEMLQKDLKIKELELQLEQSKSKPEELKKPKSHKGRNFMLIVLFLAAIWGLYHFKIKNSSHTDPSMSDSVAVGTTGSPQEPVKVSNDNNDYEANKAQTVDSVVMDSIK